MRAIFHKEAMKSQVVVGDLVEPEGIPLQRYYGLINVVVWVPENFAAFTNIIYINQNDLSNNQRRQYLMGLQNEEQQSR